MSVTDTGKRVVVVGGGLSARKTAEYIKGDKNISVTLVQGSPFIEWTVAATYVLARPELQAQYVAPNPSQFEIPGVTFVYGLATGVGPNGLTVKDHADGTEQTLPYDALVIATGFAMPTIVAEPGISLAERTREIAGFNAAVKEAGSIVVGGGGVIGLELAGDLREVMPPGCKLTVVSSSDVLIPTNPPAESARALAKLQQLGIEVVMGDRVASHDLTALEKGMTLTLKSGKTLSADVYIPAFGRGPRTGWLAESAPQLIAPKGGIAVNDFLQSPSDPKVFAIGPCNSLGEPAMFMKIDPMCKNGAGNVKAFLSGKPLKAHKEAEPGMKASPIQKIGHNTYAFTSTGAPFYPVVKACGYPCNLLCPCVWCAVCGCLPCGPQCVTCCGPCCGEPEGLATAIVWKNLMGFFFTSNIAGAGKPPAGGTAPNAEGMQR